jgi:hypothetical protein
MTERELNQIEARCDKAANGKWISIIEGRDQTGDIYLTGATDADMDFIANARQDIPKLISEIKRLRA